VGMRVESPMTLLREHAIALRALLAGERVTVHGRYVHLDGVALSGRPCFLMPGPYAPRAQVDAGLNFLRNLAASLPR